MIYFVAKKNLLLDVCSSIIKCISLLNAVSALSVNPASYLRQRAVHKLAADAKEQSRTTPRPEKNNSKRQK